MVTANQTVFGGSIGTSIAPLTSVTVVASGTTPTITFNSGATGVFAGAQSCGAAVTLNANFAFTGNSFIFSHSLNPTTATSLTIAGSETGTLTIGGPTIGTTLAPFSSITVTDVTAASITRWFDGRHQQHQHRSRRGACAGHAHRVYHFDGGLGLPARVGDTRRWRHVNTATASSGTVGITWATSPGASTGNLTLTSNGTGTSAGITIIVGSIGTSGGRVGDIDFKSPAVTSLGGNIFAHAVTFEDNLAGTPGINPAAVPTQATIVYIGGGALPSGLLINTSGNFTMEQNQKLTVFDSTVTNVNNINAGTGSLTIDSSAGSGVITVGDISAMGKITLDAGAVNNAIHIINRPAAKDLQPNGVLSTLDDNGTDLVSAVRGSEVGFALTGTVSVHSACRPAADEFVCHPRLGQRAERYYQQCFAAGGCGDQGRQQPADFAAGQSDSGDHRGRFHAHRGGRTQRLTWLPRASRRISPAFWARLFRRMSQH